MCETTPTASVLQFAQPPFQKPPFRLLSGEIEGSLIGEACFRRSSEPAAQIRPRWVALSCLSSHLLSVT